MKIPAPPLPVAEEKICLDEIAALCDAVEEALLAISEDGLDQLEDSLCKQQVLCTSLQRSLQRLRAGGPAELNLERVREALGTLRSLSAIYTRLVDQARSSTDLLHQLCSSYQAIQTSSVHTSCVAMEA